MLEASVFAEECFLRGLPVIPAFCSQQVHPMKVFHAHPTAISRHLVPAGRPFAITASIFSGAGDGKNEMLRKKCHVVRKKNHVVRKLFYVASIFSYAKGRFTCGAARGPHGLPRAESGAAAPICCKDVLTQAVRRRRHNQVRKNRFHHRVTLKYEYFRTFACPTT